MNEAQRRNPPPEARRETDIADALVALELRRSKAEANFCATIQRVREGVTAPDIGAAQLTEIKLEIRNIDWALDRIRLGFRYL